MKRSIARDTRPFLACGEWRYALLVLLLLVLAGFTAYRVTIGLAQHPTLQDAEEAIPVLTATLVALTTGFLFLAGAFGIWAIRTTNEVEARRRVSRVVENIDSLADGIVAIGSDGRITGMNQAARLLGHAPEQTADRLKEWFPCLEDADAERLAAAQSPIEFERVAQGATGLVTLRFRSQPSHGVTLVWISDITSLHTRVLMDRQRNHLQLIGRIARGVALDFNNILCSISAHAGLMDRPKRVPDVDRESLQTILQESARGAELARQLIELSASDQGAKPTRQIARHVENALSMMRMMLPRDWRLCADTAEDFDFVSLPGSQIEQIVLSLGMLVREQCDRPGRVFVRLSRPDSTGIPVEEHRFEACVEVAAVEGDREWLDLIAEEAVTVEATGLIECVVRSLVEEAGGRFECFGMKNGRHRYRFWLAGAEGMRQRTFSIEGVPDPVRAAAATWRVLMARSGAPADRSIEKQLLALGMQVDRVSDLATALRSVEAKCPYDAMMVDRSLLGGEARGLLQAILKMRPSLGLVVTTDSPDLLRETLGQEVVFESPSAPPPVLMGALWRARELAAQRSRVAA
jgi:signal transduction histidine kinase